jgi:hypothetical protein
LQALVSEHRGVVFDDSGEAWPAQQAQLARRLGRDAEHIDILANAVRNLGFVHVAPIRDALAVTFEPSVVSPLAAVAAYYEIAARSPQCLILTYPRTAGSPERCEIFNNVIEGLRRLDNAAKRDPNAARPLWQQNAAGNRANRQPNRNTAPERNPAFRASRSGRPQVNSREDDYSVRLSKPLNTIAAEDEWLTQLLNFWGSARRGRRLPSNESLDSLEVLNVARGRAHVVETANSNPAAYRFRLWGAVNSYGGGYANRSLGEMPEGLMRDDAIEDYRRVVAAATPSYHLINIVENRLSYSYARLLLPLAQDGRRVDRLIVLINERPLPELVSP